MELWMKIGSAVLLGAMIIFIWPQAKHMIKESPKGSGDDWRTFVFLIAVIALFVILLVKLV